MEEEWNNITTINTKHVVTDTDTYVPYELKIQAVNDFGLGPESNIVIGYSGEDSKYLHFIYVIPLCSLNITCFIFCTFLSGPTDAPGNLTVSKLNSNKVNVNWIPVDAKSINGEFKEYRVSF